MIDLWFYWPFDPWHWVTDWGIRCLFEIRWRIDSGKTINNIRSLVDSRRNSDTLLWIHCDPDRLASQRNSSHPERKSGITKRSRKLRQWRR